MKLVVTGVGGFVGRRVALMAARTGFEVVGVYRTSRPDLDDLAPPLKIVRTDLRHCAGLPAAYDALVHCAAEVPAFCSSPSALILGNIDGTRRLFEQARRAGARRIVYLSSMSVYGSISRPVVDETTPMIDPDVYGVSKYLGERLIEDLHASDGMLSGLTIRLPGVVGLGARNNFLSGALHRVLSGQTVAASNPDAPFNNVVHVADLSDFICGFLRRGPQGYRVVDLAAAVAMPIKEVLELLFQLAGREPKLAFDAAGKAPFTIALHAARAAGFRPRTVRAIVSDYTTETMAAGSSAL